MRAVTEHAVEVLAPDEYLSPEWYEARRSSVSASEVAAILGLSPWVSPFDLYWTKRTGEDSQDENRAMKRGRRREAAIIEDFADEHPEFYVDRVGLVRSTDRPWQVATPDALVYETQVVETTERGGKRLAVEPVAVVEAKTDGGGGGWGDDGTDEIPVYYRTQVLWQLDTLGLNVAYVPVWHGFGYREYVIEYHEGDVMLIREAAECFLDDVRSGRAPDVDAHTATARRLKKLYPGLVDEVRPIPATLVRQHQLAARLKKAADDRMRLAENRIRHALGDAAVGAVDRYKVVSRSIYQVDERVNPSYQVDRLYITRKDVES